MSDTELSELQIYLCNHPAAGPVIPGTNGLRKIRWSKQGIGKSGGLRIFYVDFPEFRQLHLITVIQKNQRENLSKEERNIISRLITDIKSNLRKKLSHGNKTEKRKR